MRLYPASFSADNVFKWLFGHGTSLLYTIVVRCVQPQIIPGMIWLLLSQGTTSVMILLNGVAVTFLLAIDNYVCVAAPLHLPAFYVPCILTAYAAHPSHLSGAQRLSRR